MIDTIFSILKNSLAITFFVLSMMLFIEYINVRTAGSFSKKIRKNKFKQVLLGTVLGIIPGCMGSYTVVTLYTHNLLSFGALIAAFSAAMGDEAFLLFSIQPLVALKIAGILFIVGLSSGLIVDLIFKKKNASIPKLEHFTIHEKEEASNIPIWKTIKQNISSASPHRSLLLFGVLIIMILSLFGQMGHSHDISQAFSLDSHQTHETHHNEGFNLLTLTFVSISLIALFIISVVSEHFLEEHFWNHVIKKHFIKIIVWTSIILAGVQILNHFVHIQDFVSNNYILLLIFAVLVGIIPESGPHVIFFTLYISGTIPLSILLANSIVQDGHAALPLFAENKKAFLKVKIINIVIGFLVGYIGLLL